MVNIQYWPCTLFKYCGDWCQTITKHWMINFWWINWLLGPEVPITIDLDDNIDQELLRHNTCTSIDPGDLGFMLFLVSLQNVIDFYIIFNEYDGHWSSTFGASHIVIIVTPIKRLTTKAHKRSIAWPGGFVHKFI